MAFEVAIGADAKSNFFLGCTHRKWFAQVVISILFGLNSVILIYSFTHDIALTAEKVKVEVV